MGQDTHLWELTLAKDVRVDAPLIKILADVFVANLYIEHIDACDRIDGFYFLTL